MSRTGAIAVRAGLFVVLAAMAIGVQAQGAMPFIQAFSFGVVSVGPDQLIRLNVANIATASGQPPCPVELAFVDSQGAVVKSARLQLDPQKSGFADLDRSDLPGSGGRVPVRATYQLTVPATTGIVAPGSVCTIAPSLELVDKASGRTLLLLTDARMVPLSAQPPGVKR